MTSNPASSRVEVFAAGGLTFGVRVEDGTVAVAAGEHKAARALVLTRLESTPLGRVPDPGASVLDAEAECSSITLMVAQRCNLRCVYCYGGDGEYGAPGVLDSTTALSALERFFRRDGPPRRNVSFFGGEPLLAFQHVRALALQAIRLAIHERREATFSMTTNATLVTDEIARWLAEHGFSVTVSIDGDPRLHGVNRPDASGRSSWPAAVRGAQRLLRFLGPERVRARATLTPGYPAVRRMLRNLKRIGFTDIALTAVEPSASAAVGWGPADFQKYREAVEELVSSNYQERHRQWFWNPLRDVVELLASGRRRDRPCGVGNSARAVSSDGSFYPCHRYVGDERFRMGAAASPEVDPAAPGYRLFEQMRSLAAQECQSCFAKAFCAGGCVHVAQHRMDSGLPPHDPEECDFIRWRTREAIRVFAGLRLPPGPGRAELLGPGYLLRPASTRVFREALEAASARQPLAGAGDSLDRAIASAYDQALQPLRKWLDRFGDHGGFLGSHRDHDWLTAHLPRQLAESALLPPLAPGDARIIGLSTALLAYLQGLSRPPADSELVRLALINGYGQVLARLLELLKGRSLAGLLPELFDEHLQARAAENTWTSPPSPQSWREVCGSKHRALVLPSLLLARAHNRSTLVRHTLEFASVAGPLRQFLDDYADVGEDCKEGRFNVWSHELSAMLGHIRPAQWPAILAHVNAAQIVRRRMETEARCQAVPHRSFQSALQSYADWLVPQVDRVRKRWEARTGERWPSADPPFLQERPPRVDVPLASLAATDSPATHRAPR